MDAIECIMNRYMCREFIDKPVKWEKIETILEAGRWASSAKNRRPWFFVVIKNQQLKEKLTIMAVRGRLRQFRNMNDKDILKIKEIQGVLAAIQNMCLVAFALGLGVTWLCSPLYIQEGLQEILSLPPDVKPITFLCIGYPATKEKAIGREPLEKITKILKGGNG